MGNNSNKNPSETEELRKRLDLSVRNELEEKELLGIEVKDKENKSRKE